MEQNELAQATEPVQATVVQVMGKAQESEDEEELDSEGEAHTVGCCAPCGCGPKVPNKTVRTRSGQILRYNLVYKVEACFGPGDGLQKDHMFNVPEAMAKMGVQNSTWCKQTIALKDVNAIENSIGCCPGLTCILLWSPILLLTGCCCCYLCKHQAAKLRQWDAAFREWQANFNQILEPLGIFVKSQSMCYVTHGSKGEKQRHIHRWLAFALTPGQITKLKAEPHLFGDIENNTCCNGIDENELCMHPGF
uniref:Uncharacterized protein n=1 Tax=Alexandrium catenella TaxID=2925 RepID=A0A7S1VYT9_ALECA